MEKNKLTSFVLTLLLSCFILTCTPFDFPPVKYKKYVLNCDEFKNCEKLYDKGMEIYKKEGCDGKTKPNFVWQIQKRGYCVDLKMYMGIAKQKAQNYKKE